MSLQNATLEQLYAWQNDIVKELCRRASLVPVPQVVQPPWAVQPQVMTQAPQPTAPQILTQHAQRLPPGTVLTTSRTDPELAARFAGVPMRPDGVPGVQGSGRGEGSAELGPHGQ